MDRVDLTLSELQLHVTEFLTRLYARMRSFRPNDQVIAQGVSSRTRAQRFVEEAMEVAQACSLSIYDVQKIAESVYRRPVGVVEQEVAGAQLTLAALATEFQVNLGKVTEDELSRCFRDIDVIASREIIKLNQLL